MAGVLLAINLSDGVSAAEADQCGQRNFGGVGEAAEHGFTKYGFPKRDAIQAPHELVIDPDLYAMGKSGSVQRAVGGDHVWHYPGAGLPCPGAGCTSSDDLFKGGVDSNFAGSCLAKFLQRFLE